MGTWDAKHRQEHGGGAAPASATSFRNLCRSSPWKWQSLRFEYAEFPGSGVPGGGIPDSDIVRAWLRRPGALRLESGDGTLLGSTTGINDSRDGLYISATRKSWLLPAHLVTPVYDDGGLVRRRPEAAYGEPSFGNGRFAAALDPVELAGNAPVPLEFPNANAVEVLEPVQEVAHEGRPALETVVSPNPGYRPLDAAAPLCGPGRTRIRIDAGTGVCVVAEPLDSGGQVPGHRIRILAVDEYMLDDLFVAEPMNLTDVREHIQWPLRPNPA
ncbi:hypothetical protein ARGLB_010_00330 [Arthrobacter globiformis NBRC 12137]|uniref:Uncharacterized protein n=1 Tax=Arthrobacter globiformis (strain ATCC 8010 / DSM 20124 / JCM 1332 / NBRC 12137 / NCIMB 8907 / NRRL B-2979 / 168) TaxID=1077972 RepID=H0QH96_ARTG1|nr:hypothetical protein [Arthrobacter globiformis]GAB12197.1 hypothetical protein ARGLB_010_00330 [Arthrobacter globiformis NBRC 12137]